jgi:hypothetical protein
MSAATCGGSLPLAAIYDNSQNRAHTLRQITAESAVRLSGRLAEFHQEKSMDRSGRVQLRVTGREKEEFTAKAAGAGIGLSEYLRKAALEIGVIHKYDQAALHQLRKIGVNLNQIAHHLNAGNDLRGDVLVSLRRCLVKLEKEIDSRQSPPAAPGSVPQADSGLASRQEPPAA